MIEVKPYTALAEIYDCVMQDVPYKRWARYIHKVIKKFKPETKTILDIACGTGNMIAQLKKLGYDVDGFDSSEEMIKIASKKINGSKIFNADMLDFKIERKYDIALCLYDSVNYILEPDKFQNLFNCVADALVDEGIFIFDISTEFNSINYAITMNTQGKCNSTRYIRRSYYDRKERVHINEFIIEKDGQEFFERHVQRIYRIGEIENFIQKFGKFKVLGKFDLFTFKEADEWSQRVHFVLRKSQSENG